MWAGLKRLVPYPSAGGGCAPGRILLGSAGGRLGLARGLCPSRRHQLAGEELARSVAKFAEYQWRWNADEDPFAKLHGLVRPRKPFWREHAFGERFTVVTC